MTKDVYILDTSAIFSGKDLNFNDKEFITTDSVSNEIQPGGKDYQKFNFLKELGLKLLSPSKDSIDKITKTSKETGDLERLSKTDIDLLALALDIKSSDKNPIIFTDDYSIQNIANFLNINFKNISQNKISKRYIWISKCIGCGKKYKEHINKCPICGTETKKIINGKYNLKK